MNNEIICPFCSSENILKTHKRHNFDVPNPFNKKIGILTIRFPMFKCQDCLEEFGSNETQMTIQSAVEEYIKKCYNEYQKLKHEGNVIKQEINETQKPIEKASTKIEKTTFDDFARKIWFILGGLIGFMSMFIWPLMLYSLSLGIVLTTFVVVLFVTGIFISNLDDYLHQKNK